MYSLTNKTNDLAAILLLLLLLLEMSQPCTAGRQWEHYQAEDPNPTQPTHGKKRKIK